MFYLYVIVSATLLVQSLHSSRWNGDNYYSRQAFPQSKDLFIEKQPPNNDEIAPQLSDIKKILLQLVDKVELNSKDLKRETKQATTGQKAYKSRSPIALEWEKWTEWSPCSVSCGKGREIRWRRCVGDCNGVQIEMHEKSCQLPACGGKLFGLIKL